MCLFRKTGDKWSEESFDIGSGILKDDRLVLKVYDDEIPFSMELDRIGVGKILGKSSYKVQDFPDDKVQTFTTQYLDVTDFYRDYMKAKAEQVESSPIDELYIMYDYNVHRRYMTARVGDIWLAEKDVTFRAVEIGNVPEDRAYDYQRYEKAEKIYKAELACIAAQARPMADGLGKPVPVEYMAEDVYFLLLDRDIRLALDAEHQMRKRTGIRRFMLHNMTVSRRNQPGHLTGRPEKRDFHFSKRISTATACVTIPHRASARHRR